MNRPFFPGHADTRGHPASGAAVPYYVGGNQSLRHILIAFEDQTSWISRATAMGLPSHSAEHASHWLFGRKQIEQTFAGLADAIYTSGSGVSVELLDIDEALDPDAIASIREPGTILWNITDGIASFKGSHVLSLAAIAGVPYFGCSSYAQHLAQDKYKLYLLARSLGITVPASVLIDGVDIIHSFWDNASDSACFVKPNSLGNKVGVNENSYSADFDDGLRHARSLGARLRDRMIVQEFVDGIEVRLTYINCRKNSAPYFGFHLVDDNNSAPAFISFRDRSTRYETSPDFIEWTGCSDSVRRRAVSEMEQVVRTLSDHIRLKDYFALDFRIDRDGKPYLIDFNSGAFLCGRELDNYTRKAFDLPLSVALLEAIKNSFQRQDASLFDQSEVLFRL